MGHTVVPKPFWPLSTKFWLKLRHGVTAETWRRVCTRCHFTGQAHIHNAHGTCWRFRQPRVPAKRTKL